MSDPTTRVRWWRRRWPWVVAALLTLAFLLRGPLLAPLVMRVVAAQLAEAIDGEATVSGADGGWFGDAHLTGVEASAPLGPLPHLRIASVAATYGWGIIRGDPAALRSLHLDGMEATIDLRARGTEATDGLPPILEWLPTPLPEVSLTGEVRLLLPQTEVLLSEAHLMVAARSISLDILVRVAAAEPVRVVATFSRPTADTLHLDQAVVIGEATLETMTLVLGRARQELTAALRLGGGRLEVRADPSRVDLTAAGLDLAAIPAPLLALAPFDTGAVHGALAGEFTAIRATTEWNLAGALRVSDFTAAGVGPFTLAAQGHLGAGSVQVPQVSLTGPGGGRLTCTGVSIALAHGRPTAGSVHAEIPDLRSWLPAFTPLPDTPLALRADLAMEGDALVITNAGFNGGGVTAQVHGSIISEPWRIEAADIDARADLAVVGALVAGAPNLAGLVRARLGGTLPLTANLTTLLTSALNLQVRSDGLTIAAVDLTGLRIDAHTDGGQLYVDQAAVSCAGIGLSLGGKATLADGAIAATVERLALNFPDLGVSAGAPFPLNLAAERWSAGPIGLHSDAGDATLEARHADGHGLLRLEAARIDLARLGFAGLSGMAGIAIDLSGAWSCPLGQVRVEASDLVFNERRAQVAIHLTQDQNGIAIVDGHLDAGAEGRLASSGTLPFTIGTSGLVAVADDGLPAAVEIELPALNRWLPRQIERGGAHLHLEFGKPDEPTAILGELTLHDVRPVVASTPTRRAVTTAALDGTIGIRGDATGLGLSVALQSDHQPVITGAVHAPGGWEPAILQGGWRRRPVHGGLTLAGLALGRFTSMVPGLLHLAGQADGGLTLDGTLAEPALGGTLTLTGIEAKVAADVPTLSAGSARLELVGSTVRLLEGVVDLGGSPVTAAGALSLTEPRHLDLRLDGTNALLVQRHDARVRADFALTLSGPLDALTLAGKAVVTNALFSPDLSLWSGGGAATDGRLVPFEFIDPPMAQLRFDVAVSSAFSTRTDGVRVLTDVVRAECDLDLHLGGTGAVPELAGRITVREGRIILPFSTLRMTTGEVVFPPGEPFQPRLNAVGTAQVRRYALTLQVDGTLADPQVHASGDGLDQRDALLLLTTGSTNAELSGEQGQRAALSRFGTWLGMEAWDLVDGDPDPDAGPGVMERVTLDFGRQVSDSGKDTIEAQMELTKPDERPEVLIFGERDRWEDYNAGIILRFRWGGEK